MTTDLSHRTFVTACLSAPVLAPAAAWGASSALGHKAAPAVTGTMRCAPAATYSDLVALDAPEGALGSVFSGDLNDPLDFEWTPLLKRPDGWMPCPELTRAITPREGDILHRFLCGQDMAIEQNWTERFTSGQWLKVEDNTAEGDIAQAEGHSPDVLDEDARAFCAAV